MFVTTTEHALRKTPMKIFAGPKQHDRLIGHVVGVVMRRIATLLVAALLVGCTSRTEFGPCIGMADDKDPALIYKVSKWNIFMGILGIEMIIPPIVVAKNQMYCPVGLRYQQ
jgi:hypothetical protein